MQRKKRSSLAELQRFFANELIVHLDALNGTSPWRPGFYEKATTLLAPAHSGTRKKIRLRLVASDWVQVCQRIGGGLVWSTQEGTSPWQRFELSRICGADVGLNVGTTPCILRTPNGSLRLYSHSLLHLGSGIAVNPNWPAPVLQDTVRLACARLDRGLLNALGSSVECCVESSQPISPDQPGVDLLLTLVASDTDERHAFSLCTTPQTALRWLSHEQWVSLPREDMPQALMALPSKGQLWLGSTRMPWAEFLSIQPGDAIRIAHPYISANGQARIRLGRMHMNVILTNAQTVRFESWGNQSMSNAEDTPVLASDTEIFFENPAQPAVMDDLQISLEFTTGHILMSLGQLRALAVGSIIGLGMAAQAKVDISANGQRIGTGELIDVDGLLAVEVIQLHATR